MSLTFAVESFGFGQGAPDPRGQEQKKYIPGSGGTSVTVEEHSRGVPVRLMDASHQTVAGQFGNAST